MFYAGKEFACGYLVPTCHLWNLQETCCGDSIGRACAFFGRSALPNNRHTYIYIYLHIYIYTCIVVAGAIIVSSVGKISVA